AGVAGAPGGSATVGKGHGRSPDVATAVSYDGRREATYRIAIAVIVHRQGYRAACSSGRLGHNLEGALLALSKA
nr:hypothetical protein [Tanacetum cinerariifolium]